MKIDSYHIGRSWEGSLLEDDCPCPKAACGLVISGIADKDCPEHAPDAMKTLRQVHSPDNCPAKESE